MKMSLPDRASDVKIFDLLQIRISADCAPSREWRHDCKMAPMGEAAPVGIARSRELPEPYSPVLGTDQSQPAILRGHGWERLCSCRKSA